MIIIYNGNTKIKFYYIKIKLLKCYNLEIINKKYKIF